VSRNDPVASKHRNVMSRFDGNVGVNFEMGIDDDHIPHFPRSNIVYVDYPWSLDKGLTYGCDFLLVYRAIHQVV
jgi:hypothetical protein